MEIFIYPIFVLGPIHAMLLTESSDIKTIPHFNYTFYSTTSQNFHFKPMNPRSLKG